MKLANYSGRATLIDGQDLGLDVADASGGRFLPSPMTLFVRWKELLEWARSADFSKARPIDSGRLMAPVPVPCQVFGVGRNYNEHLIETHVAPPLEAMVFTKFPSCIVGPNDDVPIRSGTVDWETEVVVVIGPGGYAIPQEQAWQYVAGLTLGQDLSDRAIQHRSHENPRQFCLGKSCPGFGPIGPAVLSLDEFTDPDDIGFSCSIRGEVLQQGRTSEMLLPIPRLIAEISSIVRLMPGDLIFTGTPGGIGGKRTPPRYLRPGEVLESTMEQVGTMRNRIVGGGV
ncbi:fumarylacetoacetate hydrolase family protein [Burkholderia cepacia]|uniref:fumarylacetoacetate hydrolase family protein n=1 Tax=Burkholderia cepacia TaxID=292 RepID=UPI001F2068CB|nr:fumarylacetoacetate hydrolase family protein [Burkholderia cepacia]MCE4124394.1 fumarylacetoacetate hydrolase family protein [Burkholderia cepacia]